jgi:hypothetical protein
MQDSMLKSRFAAAGPLNPRPKGRGTSDPLVVNNLDIVECLNLQADAAGPPGSGEDRAKIQLAGFCFTSRACNRVSTGIAALPGRREQRKPTRRFAIDATG